MNKNIAAVIMAAGQGKRMKNPDKSKVMHELKDKPLIQYVIDLSLEINSEKIIPVVGHQKNAVIDFIKNKLNQFKIKMSYEHLSCLSRTEKLREDFMEYLKNKESNDNEKTEKKLDNEIIFENITDIKDIVYRFRMILSTNRHKSYFDVPLVRQCNGIILVIEQLDDKIMCNVLTAPPNDFNPKYNQNEIIKHITKGNYKIYEIQDGTTINMFYDQNHIEMNIMTKLDETDKSKIVATKIFTRGKWVYSTKNCFDAGSMIWRGFSYKRVIEDVLKKYNFDFEKLSLDKTYTIGFKHPAFHPFGQNKEWSEQDFNGNPKNIDWLKSAWFIQSVVTKNIETRFEKSITEDIGLPFQNLIESMENIPNIFKKLGTSLKEFANTIKINQHMNAQCNPMRGAFLGLILRSVDEEKTVELSDILLESTLWQEIRKLIYQLPYIPNKTLREKQEQNFKNITYIILESYLDFRKRNIFIQVFPQYMHYYKFYEDTVNNVINKIYQELLYSNNSNRYKGYNTNGLDKKDNNTKNKNSIVDVLSDRFMEIIREHYQITPELDKAPVDKRKNGNLPIVKRPGASKMDKKNMKSLIVNSKYTDIYFQSIYE